MLVRNKMGFLLIPNYFELNDQVRSILVVKLVRCLKYTN